MTSVATFHSELNRLLSSNAQWAADVSKHEPGFFTECAKGQAPKVLWIGCADSRVPESVIMACKPGEIFVHRNIANQFHLDDDSAQAVLAYAVNHLGVEHVVVVGHTQCGGVAGAYDAACSPSGNALKAGTTPLSRWLTPLIQLASTSSLPSPISPDERIAMLTKLSEANVCAQVQNITASEVMQSVWQKAKTGEDPKVKNVYVHGWVYELESGRLRDLGVSCGPEGMVGNKFVGGDLDFNVNA
ncbi:carbonic anhydrase [Fomitiporia mediterranea MF3/22]|uniref:carbonic anhydrase n=1 Tax=Fomitiporia mediterranea (strain MF3/22) TaxID=694068 RepID=UPI00044080ED|nr:carbonic anhydrase [Fomitiporia mediterranea MF3/22]EJD04756.1 carbonic anhydrase [Fomitiporia mediterranea MF3/22]